MSVLRPNQPDSSPCVGRCSHNVGDEICRGCGRSIPEVRDWNQYSSERKIAVKHVAEARIAKRQS
ncbi:DUF1289 domain-containing protein (plasmid) [Pseudomonas sp. FeN3W]|nr:DUF1289 domain-containing protein [Pseudomonas sp. FeN3W]